MKAFYGRRRLINQTIRHVVLPKSHHNRNITTLRDYSHVISSTTIKIDCQSSSKICLLRQQTHTLRTGQGHFLPHYHSSSPLYHHEKFQQQKHYFSTSSTNDDNNSSTTNNNNNNNNTPNNKSLRRFASPFISLCHPDRFSSIETARKVNLNAVQTLNQMIDAVESSSSAAKNKSLHDVKEMYVIEFMVSSAIETQNKKYHPDDDDDDNKGPRQCTRREITLTFPIELLNQGRRCVTMHDYKLYAQKLKHRAMNEIGKLLRAAGVPPSDFIINDDDDDFDEPSSFDGGRRSSGMGSRFGSKEYSGRPRTHFERTRDEFTSKLDYFKMKKMHDEAMEGYHRDMATSGLTDPQRKQQIINNLVARIRIAESDDGDEEEEEGGDGSSSRIPMAEQLIALRRISLLMDAHFEIGDFEMMGRVWETLVIVLKPEEDEERGKSKRWRRRRGETGFKFSLDENEYVTVTMPLDFTDDVFVKEMKENLDKLVVREDFDEDTFEFNFLNSF